MADISEAIKLHRRMAPGKVTLRDAMTKTVAEFNKLVTLRRHRIDSQRKGLIFNLLLGSGLLSKEACALVCPVALVCFEATVSLGDDDHLA